MSVIIFIYKQFLMFSIYPIHDVGFLPQHKLTPIAPPAYNVYNTFYIVRHLCFALHNFNQRQKLVQHQAMCSSFSGLKAFTVCYTIKARDETEKEKIKRLIDCLTSKKSCKACSAPGLMVQQPIKLLVQRFSYGGGM